MSTRTPSTAPVRDVRAPAGLAALRSAVAAAALGLVILYVVGFAGTHTIHEAAHDTRHSMNFPCH